MRSSFHFFKCDNRFYQRNWSVSRLKCVQGIKSRKICETSFFLHFSAITLVFFTNWFIQSLTCTRAFSRFCGISKSYWLSPKNNSLEILCLLICFLLCCQQIFIEIKSLFTAIGKSRWNVANDGEFENTTNRRPSIFFNLIINWWKIKWKRSAFHWMHCTYTWTIEWTFWVRAARSEYSISVIFSVLVGLLRWHFLPNIKSENCSRFKLVAPKENQTRPNPRIDTTNQRRIKFFVCCCCYDRWDKHKSGCANTCTHDWSVRSMHLQYVGTFCVHSTINTLAKAQRGERESWCN